MYKPGDIIIYRNGDRHELGEVKRPSANGYFVRYHTGDTAANTPHELIIPIQNAYAFQIIRKDVNNEIQTQKAREIAARILEYFPFKGDEYYKYEDIITSIIENYPKEEDYDA